MNIPVESTLTPLLCTVCAEGNEAVSLCEVEAEYLCAECAKQHKRTKKTSSHQLIDVQPLTNEHRLNTLGNRSQTISEREVRVFMTRCELCTEDNLVTAYCGACPQSMCDECERHHRRMRATSNHNVYRVNETRVAGKLEEISRIKTGNKRLNEDKHDFCLTCDKFVEHCIDGHNVVSQGNAYNNKRGELKDMITSFTKMNADGKLRATQKVIDQENDSYALMQSEIQTRFRGYLNILVEREENLKKKLDETHKQNQLILKQRVNVANTAASAERLCRDEDVESFLTVYISQREDIKSLREFIRSGCPATLQEHILTETCTIDEFQRIIETLGEVRTSTEVSGNYVLLAQTSSTYTSGETIQNNLTNNESLQTEHRLDALSNVYLEGHLYNPSTEISDRFKSSIASSRMNPALPESIYERQHSQETVECFKEELTEENVPKGKLDILRHPIIRSLTQARLNTNNIVSDWRIVGDKVMVHANTEDDAEYCKQIVNESVFVEHIPVRPEAMLLVESDKWLSTTNMQKKKYQAQISIEVLHDKNEIAVYSTDYNILRDVRDALNKFFRENNLKIMYLKYHESIVTRLFKQPKSIKNVLCSLSQYCVDVTKHDDVTVLVKGIGIGLAQVARSIHELAVGMKCKLTIDDDDDDRDNENSDDEHSDDEIRFDDVPVENIDVEIKLKGVEAELRSLSLVGDDRVVYVFNGDVTELPVEVIVNPADKNLKHNGGLAKILVRKGGKCIQDECKEFIKQNGQLNIGDVMCSGAGSLCSHIIIHAAGPKWKDGENNEEALLEKVVAKSLAEANKRRLMSVAIPGIGAGAYGFPVGVAAKCITSAVRNFFLEKPTSCIREVYLVDIAVDTVDNFTEALRKLYDKRDHIVSTPTSPSELVHVSQTLRVLKL